MTRGGGRYYQKASKPAGRAGMGAPPFRALAIMTTIDQRSQRMGRVSSAAGFLYQRLVAHLTALQEVLLGQAGRLAYHNHLS
jgi:hypothetical protein